MLCVFLCFQLQEIISADISHMNESFCTRIRHLINYIVDYDERYTSSDLFLHIKHLPLYHIHFWQWTFPIRNERPNVCFRLTVKQTLSFWFFLCRVLFSLSCCLFFSVIRLQQDFIVLHLYSCFLIWKSLHLNASYKHVKTWSNAYSAAISSK